MSGEQEMKTIPLGDLAEICLGKVILKDDIVPDGNAKVVSISNMTEKGLNYEEMEMTNGTEEDASKYKIRDNDVLITCRGTKFRSVLVENKPPYPVMASGNLMTIRCEEAVDAQILYLYLQSAMGEAAILQLNPGKNSINLGKKQLLSLEIPVISTKNKDKMIRLWKQGKEKYEDTICEAEQDWNNTVDQLNRYFTRVDGEDLPVSVKKSETTHKNRQQDRLLIELD